MSKRKTEIRKRDGRFKLHCHLWCTVVAMCFFNGNSYLVKLCRGSLQIYQLSKQFYSFWQFSPKVYDQNYTYSPQPRKMLPPSPTLGTMRHTVSSSGSSPSLKPACTSTVFAKSMSFQLTEFFQLPTDINSICTKHGRFVPSRGCCLSAFLSCNRSNFQISPLLSKPAQVPGCSHT